MSRPPIKCWLVKSKPAQTFGHEDGKSWVATTDSCVDWVGIHVAGTPYYPEYIAGAKALGGKWCKEEKAWVFPADSWPEVDALIARFWCSQTEPRHAEVLLKVKVGGEGGLEPDDKGTVFVCGHSLKHYYGGLVQVSAPACVAKREQERLHVAGVVNEWTWYKGGYTKEVPPWELDYPHAQSLVPMTEKPQLPTYVQTLPQWLAGEKPHPLMKQPQEEAQKKALLWEPPRRMIVLEELKRRS